MTFPNRANYYLPTPEQFEAEIVGLTFLQTVTLHWQLSAFLDDVLVGEPEFDEPADEFESHHLSAAFDHWISSLKPDELINLIRWIAERLAHLYHKQACANAA